MGWFTKSKEKSKQDEIQKQKNQGIIGNYQKRFCFEYKQRQFIAPKILTIHNIKGNFDCGLVKSDRNTGNQIWSIEIRDLEFDWNKNVVPENYFLFGFPFRMDIQFNNWGTITNAETWTNYKLDWKEKYRKQIFEQLTEKKRAENFYNLVMSNSKRLSLSMLKINPLIKVLGNLVFINNLTNKGVGNTLGEYGEQFQSKEAIPNYFSSEIHLPLNNIWFRRELNDPILEEWSVISGIDEKQLQERELKDFLRKATGHSNIHLPLVLDSDKYFRLDKIHDNFRHLKYAELTTQTLLRELWVKEEYIELISDEKGVIYG